MDKLYNPFEKLEFGKNRCFLCGCYLGEDDNTSVEHIYPKWIQKNIIYGIEN